MGEHNVEPEFDERSLQVFMKALLDDLRALEYMLANDRIESGVRRIEERVRSGQTGAEWIFDPRNT